MNLDYLASDNRYFFEHELAKVFQSTAYAAEVRRLFQKLYAVSEVTLLDFPCGQGQRSLLRFRNADIRQLCNHNVEDFLISIKLAHGATKSPLYDQYDFDIDIDHLTFQIVEYQLAGSGHGLPVPLALVQDDMALSRVVDLNIVKVLQRRYP